jgi:hypothetical protein
LGCPLDWRLAHAATFLVLISCPLVSQLIPNVDDIWARGIFQRADTPYAIQAVLLSDIFDRPDSNLVGNNWVEVEATGAQVGIQANRMCFLDTSDAANRPMVRNAFQQVASGELTWEFAFDWTRTRNENIYRHFMQLG